MTVSALPLALLTAVAALSFTRVFAETTSVVPAVVAGLHAHVVIRQAVARRWHPVSSGLALVVGLGLLMAWTVAPGTTVFGIPTAETVRVLGERVGDGFGAIRTAEVPVGPHDGIVMVAALAVFVAALAADWVAFRARAVLSAAIPATTLFTLTATLGTDHLRAALTVAFVAAALSFVLAHAPAQAGEAHAWFASESRRLGPGAVLVAGLPIVLVAAAAAPLLGPRLPEARSAGLIDLAPAAGSPRTRITVSPLVDIRDRLTQDPPVEVFAVRARQPAYWRLAALETYDGQIWSSLADYRKAQRKLPADSTTAPTVPLTQEYRITGLAQFWLPAAYRPVSIDLAGARVNPASLTLLTDQETAGGLVYRVESAVPSYGSRDLTGETGRVPDDVRPFLELPADVPAAARDLAFQVTGGRRTVYEKALALQDFFRQEFIYSEEVPAGHSNDRMVDFLLSSRAGFCEQFSSSFAVMARTLGIPARVSVGFTPGDLDATGAYRVTSAEAHAWPEVYIDPYGWVAFEPTPTRFNPSPANHTGTFNPEAQQAPPERLDPDASATTVVPGGTDPATQDTEAAEETEERDPRLADGSGRWLRRIALGAAALVLTCVLATVASVRYRRRRRRRRLAGLDPAGSILVAWDDVVQQLRLEGLALRESFTPAEAARAAGTHEPELAETMDALRGLVDLAAYSTYEPDPTDAATAWTAAGDVVAVLERDDSAGRRMRRRLMGVR